MTASRHVPPPDHMSRRSFMIGGALSVAAVAAATHTGATQAIASPAPDLTGTKQLLNRVLGSSLANQISLRLSPSDARSDSFRVHGTTGRIVVSGSSPSAVLAGVGHYLNAIGVSVGYPGRTVDMLDGQLPAPPTTIIKSTKLIHRYALNDTEDGYWAPYPTWAEYEAKIDALALAGYNEIFVATGHDAVYRNLLKRFGYSSAEALDWIPSPVRQPWWLLANMSAVGPLTDAIIDSRLSLAARVHDRVRELGLTPVMPGYAGMVPAGFTSRNPGLRARVAPQGNWCDIPRPDWLLPDTPAFATVAAEFYRIQEELFGKTNLVKIDILHEGGSADGINVGAVSRGILRALRRARPEGVWNILGWGENPRQDVLNAVSNSGIRIVDGMTDILPGRTLQYRGRSVSYGTIHNYGGKPNLGCNGASWTNDLSQQRGTFSGIAYLPEASGTDSAAFELFSNLAWTEHLNLDQWFSAYSSRRYGVKDARMREAWRELSAIYKLTTAGFSATQVSLYSARPSLNLLQSHDMQLTEPLVPRYDFASVERALGHMLRASPSVKATETYRIDLMDVARTALSNRSYVLLPQLRTAYARGDLKAFRHARNRWMSDLELLERLLSTQRRTMVGPWCAAARAIGTTPAEKRALEIDARTLLTTWANRATDRTLHMYAYREWSGLVGDLYAPSWRLYFDLLEQKIIAGNNSPDILDDIWRFVTHNEVTAILRGTWVWGHGLAQYLPDIFNEKPPSDWYDICQAWNESTTRYPTEPVGDLVTVAGLVAKRLGDG